MLLPVVKHVIRRHIFIWRRKSDPTQHCVNCSSPALRIKFLRLLWEAKHTAKMKVQPRWRCSHHLLLYSKNFIYLHDNFHYSPYQISFSKGCFKCPGQNTENPSSKHNVPSCCNQWHSAAEQGNHSRKESSSESTLTPQKMTGKLKWGRLLFSSAKMQTLESSTKIQI